MGETIVDYNQLVCLNGREWATLLSFCPQYAHLCVWSKLGGDDWGNLIRAQTQFKPLYKLHQL